MHMNSHQGGLLYIYIHIYAAADADIFYQKRGEGILVVNKYMYKHNTQKYILVYKLHNIFSHFPPIFLFLPCSITFVILFFYNSKGVANQHNTPFGSANANTCQVSFFYLLNIIINISSEAALISFYKAINV